MDTYLLIRNALDSLLHRAPHLYDAKFTREAHALIDDDASAICQRHGYLPPGAEQQLAAASRAADLGSAPTLSSYFEGALPRADLAEGN